MAIIRQMSRQVSSSSAGDYQVEEQAGVSAQLAIIKQMSRQVTSSSAGDYQVEE